MRLLQRRNERDYHLTEELNGAQIARRHPYAILSHTWGPASEEIILHDLENGQGHTKRGYEKIAFCGEQAFQDGLEYFWVDSCCIRRTSDAELSYSIRSMFRWYKEAAKCYVYLFDVSCTAEDTGSVQWRWLPAFYASRWWTRSWTLQELLAPASVEFFSREGKRLGDRESLQLHIHKASGIAIHALQGSPLSAFSVAERMEWTKLRTATRPEDEVYSLLGIFDISMEPRYGEGRDESLRRLQRKMRKALSDTLPNSSRSNGSARIVTNGGEGSGMQMSSPGHNSLNGESFGHAFNDQPRVGYSESSGISSPPSPGQVSNLWKSDRDASRMITQTAALRIQLTVDRTMNGTNLNLDASCTLPEALLRPLLTDIRAVVAHVTEAGSTSAHAIPKCGEIADPPSVAQTVPLPIRITVDVSKPVDAEAGSDSCVEYGQTAYGDFTETDGLRALTRIFKSTTASFNQYMNLIESIVAGSVNGNDSEDMGMVSNLQHIKDILYRLQRQIEQILSWARMHKLETSWRTAAQQDLEAFREGANVVQRYEYLQMRVRTLQAECSDAISTLINGINLREARVAMDQSTRLGRLTVLASVFVPLSFITSLFGISLDLEDFVSVSWPTVTACVICAVLPFLFFFSDILRWMKLVGDTTRRKLRHGRS